ncbi:MAG: decarboxylating 6-phosphogluconate dehydrogenase [Pseudonocardiales bacterium]|nr:decarboxylating 6-phosphogluconate dehydrogenase [Pseudonocardiales bacterium]
MVGLGRMGANIVRRLLRGGHDCVVYDVNERTVRELVGDGATGANSLADLATKLNTPRAAWIMVPTALAGQIVEQLAAHFEPGDVIIDGGNSYYRDDIDRARALAPQGIHYLDVGTSGGVWGIERGYCLMIGGNQDAIEQLDPIFRTIAPGVAGAARTPGRDGEPTTAEQGYLHCGPPGAGHFVKMVHNGIEYGLMAAYAEGFNVLSHANIGNSETLTDAETTPLRDPEYYQYDFDIPQVAELWRRGTVIASWLLDLTASALNQSPRLDEFSGRVSDSGEGRWTVSAAVDEGVPANVLSAALYGRFSSRREGDYGDKLISAMRKQFGGHVERPTGE